MSVWIGIAGVTASMIAWVLAYTLNDLVFGWTAWGVGIEWIFLPAAVRLGAVLIFRNAGAIGIGLGSLVTSIAVFGDDTMLVAGTAIASGLSPLIAVRLTIRRFALDSSLSGLSGRQLLVCTAIYAAINAMLHNLLFWYGGRLARPFEGAVPMFVGDMLGAFLLIYLVKAAVSLYQGRGKPA